ncbi:sugar kinase [Corallincola holothuriorum]|uniref:Sugar kinase n=1 Tax=Corallincola holothuriorum TaxID=2282215 RepID=A0A368NK84_9GAMM|nr:sugar kinase [Corallincola holothuriorum]RCU51022.1 sugar kinase [Corallincola holothuriorum]
MNLKIEKTRSTSLIDEFHWQDVKSVAVVGEAMLEQRAHACLEESSADHSATVYGGDAINFAIYLKRLVGDAQQVCFISALGDSDSSRELLTSWRQEGLDCSGVPLLSEQATGRYQIHLDQNGERSFRYQRAGSAASQYLSRLPSGWSEPYDAIYLTGVTLAILDDQGREQLMAELVRFVERQGRLIFDSNFRPELWRNHQHAMHWMQQAKQMACLNLLTLEDESALHGRDLVADAILPNGCEGVIKCGQAPAHVQADGLCVAVSSVPAEVQDTTAAGDSFNAGYLAARFTGAGGEAAARCGHILAASVISQFGAIVPVAMMPALKY